MNWFLHTLQHTFKIKGRARRKEYGWFILISLLISITFFILELGAAALDFTILSVILVAMETIWGIWYTIVTITLTARRLHDLGYSGWWQLLPFFVICVLAIIATAIDEPTFMMAALGIFIIFYLIYSLCLLFKEGQRFENKYGADPKAYSNINETHIPKDSKNSEKSKTSLVQKI